MAKGLPKKEKDSLIGTMLLKVNDRRNLIEDLFNPKIKKPSFQKASTIIPYTTTN